MDLAKAAADEADRTRALVGASNSAVARIGGVVGLISSIAGQTNRPARSARIEAAETTEAPAEISKPDRTSTGHAVPAIRPDPAALGEFYKSSPTVLQPSKAPRRS